MARGYGGFRLLPPGARVAVAAALAAGALSACGTAAHSAAAHSAPTVPPSSTTSSSAPAPTTTVPPVPADPQPTAEQAAATFMGGWMGADRARSQSVATPAAVSTIFATPYRGQPLNNRGCTDAFPPLVCTWGPYADGHGSIYQVQVAAAGGRWYVSAVTIEA